MPRHPNYLTDAATFNAEFERLKKLRQEIKDRLEEVSELIAALEENKELPEDVEQNLQNLKDEATNLSTLLTTSQSYADSIEAYYKNWSATKDKIDDELIDAQRQNKLLKSYTKEASNLKDTLESELARSTSLLDDARQTLEIVTDGSLSTVFKRRSDDRKKARRWWTAGVVLAILLFASAVLTAVLLIAKDITNQSTASVWILKLALVVPFAYILFFVTKQYSHERDLEEKYAFKSLVSQTIRNNTKLLRDEFLPDDTEKAEVELKIIDFVVASLKGIYKEPYSTTKFESKFKLNPKSSSVEAQAKQTEQA